MISHAPRYQEYSAMHGDVEILRPFYEILITSGDGKMKSFSDKQMIPAGAYVQRCEMPVKIEQAKYNAGTGMEYRYRSNKRANAWRIMKPEVDSYTLKALPRDMLEKHITFDSMFRAGISQTLAGAVVGISRNCAHDWADAHREGVKALQAATDDVGGAA